MHDKIEAAKAAVDAETKKRKFVGIGTKYGTSNADQLEEQFAQETVGLITAADFKAKRQMIDTMIQQGQTAVSEASSSLPKVNLIKKSKLSFADSDESEEEEVVFTKKKSHFGKDPTAQTSFLPDADRDREENDMRARLAEEYRCEQEEIKKDKLEIVYSYWDGSGHRRQITVPKGTTIGHFLLKCRIALQDNFPELKGKTADNLLYIKEDLIIPNHISFYDLIKNKARGKSGPLFKFDVKDDVRELNDVRIEKDETHAGKIVDRAWYDKNKHIFPCSRWEEYDPKKTYSKYTISGDADHTEDIK